MRIGLIPLDERPVNTRYPAMLAAIAGVDLRLPSRETLSEMKRPANCDALAIWAQDVAPRLDALVVSCEMLGYGSLSSSRITEDPPGTVVGRLDLLRDLKRRHPSLYVVGFNVITRVSNSNHATEEAAYWAKYGKRLYRLSQLLDRQTLGQPVQAELDALRAELPQPVVGEFLCRRLRNHTVNLAMLHALAEGAFDLLVISSDDTSPYGLPSREKRWLTEWVGLVDIDEDRLLMYPGADEVGCVLMARLFNAGAGFVPHFAPHYGMPGGESVVAPFEDGPVEVTIARQVRAVGGVMEAGGDISLMVNPPSAQHHGDWEIAVGTAEREARMGHVETMVEQIAQQQAIGRSVAVADVAYSNGADPVLVELMCERVDLAELAAYGAWNTAGNTIGVVLAQACAAQLIEAKAQREAQARFLVHRFVEDWGYQHRVRREARERFGSEELDDPDEAAAWIEPRLQAALDQLPGFASRYRIEPGSVWLPWRRLFEVDFDLVARQ